MVDLTRGATGHVCGIEGRVELVHLTAFGIASLANEGGDIVRVGAPRPSSTPAPCDRERGAIEGLDSLITHTHYSPSPEGQGEGEIGGNVALPALTSFDR